MNLPAVEETSKALDYMVVERCRIGYNSDMSTGFVERKGKLEELDRSFDLEFWQAQPPQVRFQVAWDLIVHAWKAKGQDVRQLRLQRSIETFQRQQR